jgi:hypothetical protein
VVVYDEQVKDSVAVRILFSHIGLVSDQLSHNVLLTEHGGERERILAKVAQALVVGVSGETWGLGMIIVRFVHAILLIVGKEKAAQTPLVNVRAAR